MSAYAGSLCGGPLPMDEMYAFGLYGTCACGLCWWAEVLVCWLAFDNRPWHDNWGRERSKPTYHEVDLKGLSACPGCGQDLTQPPEPQP